MVELNISDRMSCNYQGSLPQYQKEEIFIFRKDSAVCNTVYFYHIYWLFDTFIMRSSRTPMTVYVA